MNKEIELREKCNQCKNCAVKEAPLIDCSDDNCKCHSILLIEIRPTKKKKINYKKISSRRNAGFYKTLRMGTHR